MPADLTPEELAELYSDARRQGRPDDAPPRRRREGPRGVRRRGFAINNDRTETGVTAHGRGARARCQGHRARPGARAAPRRVRPRHQGASTFSSTTARPWPTPMQIAATPQRSPRSRSTLGQRAEDAAARGAERVADGDRAAVGVDDVGVDLPGVDAGQRLHGERLVELDGADVVPADARRGASARFGGLDRAR